jgi:hypothetical protein
MTTTLTQMRDRVIDQRPEAEATRYDGDGNINQLYNLDSLGCI